MNDSQPKLVTVDPKLAYIISQVEASGFSGALRFEPSVYREVMYALQTGCDGTLACNAAHAKHVSDNARVLVSTIAKINRCTDDTARVLYATSFGLYQIMGYNLYSLGLSSPISNYLNGVQSRTLQDGMFSKFLAGHGLAFTWDEMARDPDKLNYFALHYNGSVAYGDRMKAVAKEHYGEKLT
ncbi:MAG: N-acetylmuramidase domain-containing protein [Terriglobia bacterium]